MRIILLNNHEAIVKDDKQPTVTLVNADNGTLVVEGERFAVKNGVKNPCIPDMIGIVRAYFEDARGVRWRVIKPRIPNVTKFNNSPHVRYTSGCSNNYRQFELFG